MPIKSKSKKKNNKSKKIFFLLNLNHVTIKIYFDASI